MPALKAAGSVYSAPRIDTRPPCDTWKCHTARSVIRWGRSGAVISVHGELDASNSRQLADYVQRTARFCEWLILDLHALEFIGTTGLSALKAIASRCTDTNVYCTMVPGVAVARLLRICDPASVLPTTTSVTDALAGVQSFRPAL
ncbi:STAS domain-containing protein [[Mycobacterium] nativiensis]|uniref:STAS domain-containing protein n=1 Tax=[Mycobacterium] nativiensis TaxID=2855503 RepID=A0ABU5XZ00_9MYCO|nr:STAS domain-containing protein [Mycolicibacter sp. MYC340]MEB3033204.1 STAS domain-containing protein [Mycolicibacter sp. MYC340]